MKYIMFELVIFFSSYAIKYNYQNMLHAIFRIVLLTTLTNNNPVLSKANAQVETPITDTMLIFFLMDIFSLAITFNT